MLEEVLTAEMLVVGVLHPTDDDSLVGQPVGVLKIQKPRNETRWQTAFALSLTKIFGFSGERSITENLLYGSISS